MELQPLRDFIALAEELHYERPVMRLGANQAGLSRRIRDLERDVGVRLFASTTRDTTLAPACSTFLPFARCILGTIAQVVRAAHAAGAQSERISSHTAPSCRWILALGIRVKDYLGRI